MPGDCARLARRALVHTERSRTIVAVMSSSIVGGATTRAAVARAGATIVFGAKAAAKPHSTAGNMADAMAQKNRVPGGKHQARFRGTFEGAHGSCDATVQRVRQVRQRAAEARSLHKMFRPPSANLPGTVTRHATVTPTRTRVHITSSSLVQHHTCADPRISPLVCGGVPRRSPLQASRPAPAPQPAYNHASYGARAAVQRHGDALARRATGVLRAQGRKELKPPWLFHCEVSRSVSRP